MAKKRGRPRNKLPSVPISTSLPHEYAKIIELIQQHAQIKNMTGALKYALETTKLHIESEAV